LTFGDHLRKTYYDEFNQCIAEARCSDLGVSAFDNDCRAQASDRIGVNLKTIKLCEAVSEMLDRCAGGVSSADPKPCQQSMKIFNDTTLEDATKCSGESCHDISKCFTESLGVLPGPMATESE
jgi:cytochrome c peroxidase